MCGISFREGRSLSAQDENKGSRLSGPAARHALVALTLLLAQPAHSASAQGIVLKFSHFLPPSHGIQTDLVEPWAKALDEKTAGKVKVEIFAGDSPLGDPARQTDQLRAAASDIAFAPCTTPRARFERTAIIELPFMVKDAGTGSRVLWELYKDGTLKPDFQGFKVLALMTHHGGLVHTVSKPVELADDLKGLRLRSPTDAVSAMVALLGAHAIGLPSNQTYEHLQKGKLDGVLGSWDFVATLKLNEVLKHHTEGKFYTVAFCMLMDQKRFDELPEEVRTAIDELSGEALLEKFGPLWDRWDAGGFSDAKVRGHDIITLTDEQRETWRERVKPMTDDVLAALERQGIQDARAIHARMQGLLAKYDGK